MNQNTDPAEPTSTVLPEDHGPAGDSFVSPDPAPANTKVAEAAVAAWATSVRESFGRNRKDYNFAVCDALAAAGLAPTAFSVLRVGKWGQSVSVTQDVSAWYQNLSERLRSMEADIPLAARRQANALLDQLFQVARQSTAEEIEKVVAPLRESLEKALEEKAALEGINSELDTSNAELRTQLGIVNAKADLLADKANTAEHQLQKARNDIEDLKERTQAQQLAAERQVSQAKQELATANADHAKAMLEAHDRADVERRRLMLAADAERNRHKEELKGLVADLKTSQAQVEALRQEISALNVAEARSVAEFKGVTEMLAVERGHFAERESFYKSEDYRFEPLMSFAAQAIKGGIAVTVHRKDAGKAVSWLADAIGMGEGLAHRFVQSLPVPKVSNGKN